MRVVVAGTLEKPILLDTDKATAILIETDDGNPDVIFRLFPSGKGWMRYTRGEDKNFNEIARQLGLI